MTWTVEAAFDVMLRRQGFSPNQLQVARARIESIGTFFADNYAMAQTVFSYGSYARGTIPAGQRDLDLLAPFASSYWSRYGADSRQFLYSIRNTLDQRYHATEVSTRQVAVKLDFSQIVTDVVPGFVRDGGGYWIPDGSGGWQPTNPTVHGSIVQQDDAAAGLRLRPLARLMKDWNNANGRKLTSFHLEMMTFAIKRGHAVGVWPAEVAIVLAYLPGWIRRTLPDPWASGKAVDAYLRADQREAAARVAELDAERAENAESLRLAGRVAEAFDRWRIVYNQTFPGYG